MSEVEELRAELEEVKERQDILAHALTIANEELDKLKKEEDEEEKDE